MADYINCDETLEGLIRLPFVQVSTNYLQYVGRGEKARNPVFPCSISKASSGYFLSTIYSPLRARPVFAN